METIAGWSKVLQVTRYRWTRDQYERLLVSGILGEDPRVELLEGEILEKTPQGNRYLKALLRLQEAMRALQVEGHHVRIQAPLSLGDDSMPEPDLAIVPGTAADYDVTLPAVAALIVEIAETSPPKSRLLKAPLYARCGIPELWILNVTESCLEVYRHPKAGTYRTKVTLQAGDTLEPLALGAVLLVGDLLPE